MVKLSAAREEARRERLGRLGCGRDHEPWFWLASPSGGVSNPVAWQRGIDALRQALGAAAKARGSHTARPPSPSEARLAAPGRFGQSSGQELRASVLVGLGAAVLRLRARLLLVFRGARQIPRDAVRAEVPHAEGVLVGNVARIRVRKLRIKLDRQTSLPGSLRGGRDRHIGRVGRSLAQAQDLSRRSRAAKIGLCDRARGPWPPRIVLVFVLVLGAQGCTGCTRRRRNARFA